MFSRISATSQITNVGEFVKTRNKMLTFRVSLKFQTKLKDFKKAVTDHCQEMGYI